MLCIAATKRGLLFCATETPNAQIICTGDMVATIEDCQYYYAVEDNQDRDGDGVPDFLGKATTDSISLGTATAVSGAVSAVVAAAVAASVGAAVGATVVGSLTASVGGGVGAGGAASGAAGAAGGALTPLIAQAQFLGIAGQIGGKGALPASASSLSSGLGWTNFNLPFKFFGSADTSGPGSQRRKVLAGRRLGRRDSHGLPGIDKCKLIEQSETELGQKLLSVVIAIASAFQTRIFTRAQEIFNSDDDKLRTFGGVTIGQFLGFTWSPLATESSIMGATELPAINKAWQGLSESATEAANSGCYKYELGGGVVLFFMLVMILSVVYIINKAVNEDLIKFRWNNHPKVMPYGQPFYQSISEADKMKLQQGAGTISITGRHFGLDTEVNA